MSAATFEAWRALWHRLNCAGDSEPTWQKLVTAYEEPPRAYHNLLHIGQCLEEFDGVCEEAEQPDVVELAIWFHDAVYDPKRKDNEEESAVLLRSMMSATGLPSGLLDIATELILATKHTQSLTLNDAKLLVDVDLSILGQPAAQFDRYEEQIRREYEWVPWPDYVKGRSAVLTMFLERSFIYGTERFRGRYEEHARKNLRNSLKKLASAA